jgi:DNA-directed RNA polymerase subunit RPC12/RpoP
MEEEKFLDDDEDEPVQCPVCPGEGVILGALGTRVHYRCRDCGMEFSRDDEDDDEPN